MYCTLVALANTRISTGYYAQNIPDHWMEQLEGNFHECIGVHLIDEHQL